MSTQESNFVSASVNETPIPEGTNMGNLSFDKPINPLTNEEKRVMAKSSVNLDALTEEEAKNMGTHNLNVDAPTPVTQSEINRAVNNSEHLGGNRKKRSSHKSKKNKKSKMSKKHLYKKSRKNISKKNKKSKNKK